MLALIYCAFAIICGWLEAILYDRRGAEAFKGNEHTGMTLQRISAAMLPIAAVLLYHFTGSFLVLLELLPAALLFPMSHDEAYNFTRLWLAWCALDSAAEPMSDKAAFVLARSEYKYGYQSPTTTARNDFGGKARTWLAGIGLALLILLQVAYFLA